MPREFTGSPYSQEVEGNRPEDQEKKEFRTSIVPAQELVEKINAREELELNNYQRSCKYALLFTSEVHPDPGWMIGDLEGYLKFYRELPDAVRTHNDKRAEILFCGSKSDVRLEGDLESSEKGAGIGSKIYRTPDGTVYRKTTLNTSKSRSEPLFQILERS